LFQRLNQPELAFEYYQQAVAKSPAEPDFLLAEAKMLVAMGRTPEAIEILNSKSSDFRTSTTFCDTLGQLLMQSQEYSQAEELFRQASNLSKGDRQIARRFAMALYANRHYPECVIVLSKLIARQSVADRPSLLVMLGYSLDQLGRHPEAAKCYQLALTINPDDPMTTQWIASIDLDDLKD
jgi:tetratricopeptide (TPR) repeat protein